MPRGRMGYKLGIAVVVVGATVWFFRDFGLIGAPLICIEIVFFLLWILAVPGDPISERWFRLPQGALGKSLTFAAITLGVVLVLPWVGAFDDSIAGVVFLAGMIFAFAGTWSAVRPLPGGYAFAAATVLLIVCAIAAGGSTALAYVAHWQGLEWEPPYDGLDGTSAEIGLPVVAAVFVAPVAGLALGLLSQVNKPPAAARG